MAKYISESFDLTFTTHLISYNMGSQYSEGYCYNTPTTETSTVMTPYGNTIITTHGTKQNYVSGRMVPAAFACVKFEINDTKTGKTIWTRIDDRSRANETEFDNTKPLDLYKRIIKNYFKDLESKLHKVVSPVKNN